MSPTVRFALILTPILTLPLVLGGCGGSAKKEKDQRTAAGEVLPGSISDSMLPFDTARSQPPLAPKEAGKAGPRSGAAAESDAAADTATDPAAPAPAASPEAPAPAPPAE